MMPAIRVDIVFPVETNPTNGERGYVRHGCPIGKPTLVM